VEGGERKRERKGEGGRKGERKGRGKEGGEVESWLLADGRPCFNSNPALHDSAEVTISACRNAEKYAM